MKRAVVIGAGIAGLAAGKVLSNHFEEVTIFDGGDASQGQHLHVLLKEGQRVLEKLFPGIREKLKASGCPEIDWARDTLWENLEGTFSRYDSGIRTLSMSRHLLETRMKEELGLLNNVKMVKEKKSVSRDEEVLTVVASGQNFSPPLLTEKVLPLDLTYRSLVFKADELEREDFKQYYFQVDPPRTTIGGVICPIEEGKAMVTLIEKEEQLSRCEDLEDFLLKARQVQGGRFYHIIRNARPLTRMATFRKSTMHRRRPESTPGTIMIGDVLTSLNPVYGQGMTVALKQVEVLEQMLTNKSFDERKFQRSCYRLGALPFLLCQSGGLLRSYLHLAQRSRMVHKRFLSQMHSLRIL